MLDELGARYDAAVVVHHVGEQPVLVRGELDQLAVDRDARSFRIEPQRPALEFRLGMAGRAAQLRPDAGQQLLHVEGLRHVVVGARVHAGDLVAPAVARGQDDDVELLLRPPPLLQDRDAIHLGQAEIEDHHVVGLGVAEEVAVLAVAGAVDGIAGLAQRVAELTVEVWVIFDDENAHVGLRWGSLWTARSFIIQVFVSRIEALFPAPSPGAGWVKNPSDSQQDK